MRRRRTGPPAPASWSCPTSAASTGSTRRSRSGSPSAGTRRSRSTTSGALPGPRSAPTTSSTCRASSRRPRRACRGTSARASRTSETPAAARSSPSASASAAATRGSRLRAVTASPAPSVFYGRPGEGRPLGTPGPIQRAAEMTAPILALQGGDDPGIPVEDSQAFDEALDAAGVEHEVVIYPGAPHSFFDRKQGEFAAESEDAWSRVLAFLERYS
ncbi:MAG TPA: dienelactone hydrolase family protein [Gaiellaceae bacterium]|nr:dienelactone hydrolase family protein [Gaiellaceae bacterium]